MMKKALMVASVASMIEQFNMDNIRLLQNLGYEVHVACNFLVGNTISDCRIEKLKDKLNKEGVMTFQISIPRQISNLKEIITSYHIVKGMVEQEEYSIVHCHSPIGGVITRLACKNVRKNGTKVIYTAHGFHFYKGAPIANWALFYPIEKYCAKYTDRLITINKEDYRRAAHFHLPTGGAALYAPGVGVDVQKIERVEVNAKEVKDSLGIPTENPVILSVGELNANKNHEVIIRALAELNMPNLHYVICGKGELEKYLKQLCAALGVEKQVVFTGFSENIVKYMKMADIFVFPSKREGLSLALMEAMAAGLPVVCYNARGNGDLIEDGKGGRLLGANTATSFAESIKRLIEDEKTCETMSQFNKKKIKKYDLNRISGIMFGIYKGMGKI